MHVTQLSVGGTQVNLKDSHSVDHGVTVIQLTSVALTRQLPIIRWLPDSSLCLITSLLLSCFLIGL